MEALRKQSGGIRIFVAVADFVPSDAIVMYDYTENSERGMARLGEMIAKKMQGRGRVVDKQVYWAGQRTNESE